MQWDIVSLCSFVFTRAAILSHGNSELHDLHLCRKLSRFHYSDVITSTMASQITRPHFYQTRSAWSVDQGSNKNHSPAYNFAPTVTKFCVMWEGLSLPHDTKCGNCRCKIVDSRAFPSWSLIHGLRWSGLIKAEPASRLLTQPFIQAQISKKNQSSASLVFVWGIHQWPVTFPAQRTSNVANISIWWRHHVEKKNEKKTS